MFRYTAGSHSSVTNLFESSDVVRPFLREWYIPIAVALAAVVATLLLPAPWLRLERAALQHGQLWRLLTGHLAHLDAIHLTFNLLGLFLVWLLFRRVFNTASWLVIMLFAGLATSAGLYFFSPAVTWYVGLSGVLHALFVAGAIGYLRFKPAIATFWLIVISAKIAVEQLAGPISLTALTGARIIVDAHFYGRSLG